MLAILKKLNRLIGECTGEQNLIVKTTQLRYAPNDVVTYLNNLLRNLEIKIGGCVKEKVLDLINLQRLEGWCWQSTQTCSIFFNDDDCIERGNLYLPYENNREYFHSWICFKFNAIEYVFDPCLDCLCTKEEYYATYKVQMQASVKAKAVKEKLIYEITHKKPGEACWLDPYMSEEQKNETLLVGQEDINAPFFRSDVGYIATIEDEKVTELMAHYYYNA